MLAFNYQWRSVFIVSLYFHLYLQVWHKAIHMYHINLINQYQDATFFQNLRCYSTRPSRDEEPWNFLVLYEILFVLVILPCTNNVSSFNKIYRIISKCILPFLPKIPIALEHFGKLYHLFIIFFLIRKKKLQSILSYISIGSKFIS